MNLGNPGELSIRELAERSVTLAGSKSKIVNQPLPSDDPTQRQPDISFAEEKLGWEPSISLEQGLAKTIEYFEKLFGQESRAGMARRA